MTHAFFQQNREIPWDECVIEHFRGSNNGITLSDSRNNVLIYIQGEDVGIQRSDELSLIKERAGPIFKMALTLRNQALSRGIEIGRAQKLAEIKAVLAL